MDFTNERLNMEINNVVAKAKEEKWTGEMAGIMSLGFLVKRTNQILEDILAQLQQHEKTKETKCTED